MSWRKNFPVPVLAEPETHDALCEGVSRVGEARESTNQSPRPERAAGDSRGGENTLSGGTTTDKALAALDKVDAGGQRVVDQVPPAQKIEELRELVANVSKEPAVKHAPQRPLIYRNDFGAVITERQWNILRKKKEEAKAGGYELDEYSQ